MSYTSIAQIAQDPNLRMRIAACLAQESTGAEQPTALADLHIGDDPAVITDVMILAAVEAVLAAL